MSSATSEETALNEAAHDVQILFPNWLYVTYDNIWYDIVSFGFDKKVPTDDNWL